jgi:hypothetical protein
MQSSGKTCREIAKLFPPVTACDKREAFAQGSEATKQSIHPRVEPWIASLRSQ